MALNLSILYRGSLSSCNYDCGYCPFAKHYENPTELQQDRDSLQRFVTWISDRPSEDQLGILFTPWGEALIRSWYREAIIHLTRLSQVTRVAIQTNLSCGLDWVERCERSKLALWTTYHPSQVEYQRFLNRCFELMDRGIRFSVGVVGLRENFEAMDQLRGDLPSSIYLWVNAYKDVPNYYQPHEIDRLRTIDPLFLYNNRRHPSRGKSCRTGATVISVDGEGMVRRCHFIRTPLGNILDSNFESILQERLCTNDTCGCHIGYVHLEELKLYEVFGSGVLERIPERFTANENELEMKQELLQLTVRGSS